MADPDALIEALPAEQADFLRSLCQVIRENIPAGFEEKCDGKMIHWVVPLAVFPQGYHCTPGQALGMVSVGAAKEGVTFHHMGLYFQPARADRFKAAVESESGSKADMGKACLRMKKPAKFAPEAIAALLKSMPLEEYLGMYTSALASRGKS